MKSFIRHFTLCTLVFGAAFLPAPSHAVDQSLPLVVEMFSSAKCSADPIVQKRLQNVMKEFPNAILVNCRTANINTDELLDDFADPFCDARSMEYFMKLHMLANKSPFLIINGKYEANNNDIESVFRMAQSVDTIKPIGLKMEGQKLTLSMPENGDGALNGEVYVYVYLPTHEKLVEAAQPAPASDPALPHSEPFQGAQPAYNELYLRPVIAITKLADWKGAEKTLSYTLPERKSDKFKDSDLSYVAVLYSGKSMGDVLAAGELKSATETKINLTLPDNQQPEEAPQL